MPRKNTVRSYIENGYYHVYNRGVEKRIIFIERNDYVFFLHLLKTYLVVDPNFPFSIKPLNTKNNNRIILLAYSLLPNHFHLLLWQNDVKAVSEFLKRVCTSYSMFFNKKYERVGSLFQGKFKASLIDSNRYLLHLSKYIHENPLDVLQRGEKLEDYLYSSYLNYLGRRNQEWLNTKIITDLLKEEYGPNETYSKFMGTADNNLIADINLILEETPTV